MWLPVQLKNIPSLKNTKSQGKKPYVHNHRYYILCTRDCVPPAFIGTLRVVLVNTLLL